MFRIFRRKKRRNYENDDSVCNAYVQRIDGSWKAPVQTNGGLSEVQREFIDQTLLDARNSADAMSIPAGSTFSYILPEMSSRFGRRFEIIFGLNVHASRYGLEVVLTKSDSITFKTLY